jgi:hypothetical protein
MTRYHFLIATSSDVRSSARAASCRSRSSRVVTSWARSSSPPTARSNQGNEILGDAMVAAGLLDRLVHHATRVTQEARTTVCVCAARVSRPSPRLRDDANLPERRKHLGAGALWFRKVAHFLIPVDTGSARALTNQQMSAQLCTPDTGNLTPRLSTNCHTAAGFRFPTPCSIYRRASMSSRARIMRCRSFTEGAACPFVLDHSRGHPAASSASQAACGATTAITLWTALG